MSASDLLSRLTKVKPTGRGTWIACCPAHADKSPSMTIRELDDGRVLMHCFAGCDAEAILAATGLTFESLFPASANPTPPSRFRFPAADVLESVAREALVASVCASTMAQGRVIPDEDRSRLLTASRRLAEAVEMIRGDPLADRLRWERVKWGGDAQTRSEHVD